MSQREIYNEVSAYCCVKAAQLVPTHAFSMLVTCTSSSSQPNQADSPSIQSPALLMCVSHMTFSSHKAISRLLPLYPVASASILSCASASLRSLQPCRLRCFLDELEACSLANSIFFWLIHPRLRCIVSLYKREGIPKEAAKSIGNGEFREHHSAPTARFHVTPVAFVTENILLSI